MLIKKIRYGGWSGCWQLRHNGLEMVVVSQIGPRIMRFGFEGGENLLHIIPRHRGKRGTRRYRHYGGHRLWSAPETRAVTYTPDNEPVKVVVEPDALRLLPKADRKTGVVKELVISPSPQGGFRLLHRLGNRASAPREAAAWAITMLRPLGVAEVPLPPPSGIRGLPRPTGHLVWWRYTHLDDSRLHIDRASYQVKAKILRWKPFKVGSWCPLGEVTYRWQDLRFTKRFASPPGRYPDLGCNVQVFSQGGGIELETLSPLKVLQKGQWLEHTEDWDLEKV
jgi:hypothetical protein